MPNHLATESSPYLLQHQNNPVDWYPWAAAAMERAKSENKPIFLSIKFDREEPPDLDQIYMNAVQIMTGRGGWPMSVFLTPDLQPFFGGTYWPPAPRMGMPGFDQVLRAVVDAW